MGNELIAYAFSTWCLSGKTGLWRVAERFACCGTGERPEKIPDASGGILEISHSPFPSDEKLGACNLPPPASTSLFAQATDLAAKCTAPFVPADAAAGTPATATCCASDITLAEFKTLCGKMDASDPSATTVEEYLGGTANFRTDLYSSCGTLVTHAESIELIDSLGAKFTPELKSPAVEMVSCARCWSFASLVCSSGRFENRGRGRSEGALKCRNQNGAGDGAGTIREKCCF